VSNLEQTIRRPRCFHSGMGINDGYFGDSVNRLGTKKGIEDLIPGHALIFKGVTDGPSSDPPFGYERAGRGFGIGPHLGLWLKRGLRPLCL